MEMRSLIVISYYCYILISKISISKQQTYSHLTNRFGQNLWKCNYNDIVNITNLADHKTHNCCKSGKNKV